MSIFDNIQEKILANFSEWIQVQDPKSNWTIEDFSYETGVDEVATNPHCWKCVTVNQCWFKNEKVKKPEYFDYSDYSFSEISKSKRGLYHPNCHCREKSINVPKIKDVQILELRNKFNDFFKRKKGIYYGLGYTYKDENEIINAYIEQVKNSFKNGNYSLFKHWEYGFQINIHITVIGKQQFKNEKRSYKTGIFIFPNGKLKIATVFAGGVQ